MTSTFTVDVLVSAEDRRRVMEEDVRAGLLARPRSVPPVWFYDEVGGRLFDEITRLPEYYLTRAERSILVERAGAIVDMSGADTLVEIGSGTSEKTLILLDAMATAGRLERVVLLDISEEILREAARSLGERYDVEVRAVVGDLRRDLARLPEDGKRLWAFLGSTIGNFEPGPRSDLLHRFASSMAPGDSFLLGTDLEKETDRIVAAYNDSRGVTAAFNLNVLSVLNSELGADFDPRLFRHRAVWDHRNRWVEMRLQSLGRQEVSVRDLGIRFDLDAGEEVLTEVSAKFDRLRLPGELARAGFETVGGWTDAPGDFLLTLARLA